MGIYDLGWRVLDVFVISVKNRIIVKLTKINNKIRVLTYIGVRNRELSLNKLKTYNVPTQPLLVK